MSKVIHIYTDGGCRMKKIGSYDNIGGWAYTLEYDGHHKENSGAIVNATNNQMELLAQIEALSSLKRFDIPVVIYSDSAYCIGGITSWVDNWKKNGWKTSKKQPVDNKDLWVELDRLKALFNDIKWVKVKGHSGVECNEKVDWLVNKAMDELEMRLDGR